jgi:hypothetical protein
MIEMSTADEERNPPMASGGSANGRGRRSLVLACEVSADQEEPWRRLLQELSDPGCKEEYLRSRRRLGIVAESVWLVPKRSGGGMTVVYLEAEDAERMLAELEASEAPFETWYRARMRKLFGFDLVRLPRAVSGELLFAWRDDDVPGEREAPKNPRSDAPVR